MTLAGLRCHVLGQTVCRLTGHNWAGWWDVVEGVWDRQVVGQFRCCTRCGRTEDRGSW